MEVYIDELYVCIYVCMILMKACCVHLMYVCMYSTFNNVWNFHLYMFLCICMYVCVWVYWVDGNKCMYVCTYVCSALVYVLTMHSYHNRYG